MRNHLRTPFTRLASLLCFCGLLCGQSSPYKVIRKVSGVTGHEENGRYVMDDPRSVFVAGKDTKITVYFEWEGPLGQHHFEGLWKRPDGKISLISDFRYEAKSPRFSGYWTMLLSDAAPSGEWNLEARIDGEPAGTHSFVISGSPSAAASASTPRVLDQSEEYQRATDASVTIDKIGADGAPFGKGLAFWVGEGRLLTAFDAIDGATLLRIHLRDGSQLTTDQVVAWNRWQDWALLKTERSSKAMLTPGTKEPLKVGDRCVFLDLLPAGARLVDGSITGRNAFPRAGERLLLASGVTPLSSGGPLLDEYGNYVGIVGGNVVPGADPMKILNLLSDSPTGHPASSEIPGMAVPSNLLPDFGASPSPVPLSDLARRGEFVDPLIANRAIQFATLAGAVIKQPSGGLPSPADYRRVFSQRENKAVVFVNWQPISKEKVLSVLRWFDTDNKLISQSKPRELSFSPGGWMTTIWEIPLNNIPLGIYRVDLVLNNKTAWREFFRITE